MSRIIIVEAPFLLTNLSVLKDMHLKRRVTDTYVCVYPTINLHHVLPFALLFHQKPLSEKGTFNSYVWYNKAYWKYKMQKTMTNNCLYPPVPVLTNYENRPAQFYELDSIASTHLTKIKADYPGYEYYYLVKAVDRTKPKQPREEFALRSTELLDWDQSITRGRPGEAQIVPFDLIGE